MEDHVEAGRILASTVDPLPPALQLRLGVSPSNREPFGSPAHVDGCWDEEPRWAGADRHSVTVYDDGDNLMSNLLQNFLHDWEPIEPLFEWRRGVHPKENRKFHLTLASPSRVSKLDGDSLGGPHGMARSLDTKNPVGMSLDQPTGPSHS